MGYYSIVVWPKPKREGTQRQIQTIRWGGGAVIQSLRDKEGVSKKIFVSPLGLSLV